MLPYCVAPAVALLVTLYGFVRCSRAHEPFNKSAAALLITISYCDRSSATDPSTSLLSPCSLIVHYTYCNLAHVLQMISTLPYPRYHVTGLDNAMCMGCTV
jgi:hypothetical protein